MQIKGAIMHSDGTFIYYNTFIFSKKIYKKHYIVH